MAVGTKPSVPVHGVPRRGYVLSTAVEEIADHVRKVVQIVVSALAGTMDVARPFSQADGTLDVDRIAWRAVSAWMLWNLAAQRQNVSSLAQAQQWYIGKPLTAQEKRFWQNLEKEAQLLLTTIVDKEGVHDLLPYILESHGPGSRLSVRRDPSTRTARTAKKALGVFYTPPDVAEYMATEALQKCGRRPKVFDPAVGTGVFLRAVLTRLRSEDPHCNPYCLAQDTLFGCDIDAQALDGAATVILADVLPDALSVATSPLNAWQTLRANLRQCDATLIDPETKVIPGRRSLHELFPSVESGFDVVIGNPPYADLGGRSDTADMVSQFQTVAVCNGRIANLYPIFVEQMIRLAGKNASGALVLPLSLACNSGRQFRACRDIIAAQPGHWRFAFFDRQPHALFGEDVKTRNSIVFWDNSQRLVSVSTGPLRKWRGDDRQEMFSRIDFTPVDGNISDGIPKLHGSAQVLAWQRLKNNPDRLSSMISGSGRAGLSDLPGGADNEVFVAPTAYNFLGVARPCPLTIGSGEILSLNPMIRMNFSTEEHAAAAYAILSGNLAFWWWHVTGDGFHITQGTLGSLPVGVISHSDELRRQMAALGRKIWKISRASPVRSVNRGRVSYAFQASVAPELRREVDHLLLHALNLPAAFAEELEDFTKIITEARLFKRRGAINEGATGMKEDKISAEIKEKSIVTKEEWREYTKTVWSIANKARPDHPAAFPEEIPHRLTKLFSFYGETVLDPFAGTGSTARAAIPLGRKAVCVEQNPEYTTIIRSECSKLQNGHAEDFAPLDVFNGDSRNMDFLDTGSVGLIVTSPPYWDKADYGTGENNLGNIANYKGFLDEIRPVFEECYRVLKPGRKMCVVTANVNQHTEEGLLTFPLATDFAVILRSIGFVMVNEIIWSKDGTGGKWGSFGAQRPIFGSYPYPPNFLFKNIHEYVLIFAKPALTKRKGPKVKKYGELMGGLEYISPLIQPEIDDEQATLVEN